MSDALYNRGNAQQVRATPKYFVDAVAKRFGPFTIDLAGDEKNKKAPQVITREMNTFCYDWHKFNGNLWLNPEFTYIKLYARKCLRESEQGAKIIMLSPARMGTGWFRNYVFGRALVSFIWPRFPFDDLPNDYPQDLMLSIFGFGRVGFECWNWEKNLIQSYPLQPVA